MAPSPIVVSLISVMTESFLVGAYAVLEVAVVWLLISGRRTMPKIRQALFCVSIVMFLVAIAHLGLVVQQIAAAELLPANLQAQLVLVGIQFMLGDMVFIWRVWVVWGHNCWIAIGPFVTMAIGAGFVFSTAVHEEENSPLLVASVAMIVANTTICTLLIAGRIWYSRYQVRDVRQMSGCATYGGFSKTVILFIETGVLITASQVTCLILNFVNSPGLHILLDLQMPLIGILPTLIIVVVHFDLVVGPVMSHASQSRGTSFKARHISQLDASVASSAHSEDTGRSTKPTGVV